MGLEKDPEGKGTDDRLSLSLTVNQKIWLLFVVPTALCCVVYVADIATDVAMVDRHFSDNRCVVGSLTLILIYLPAIAFFVLTLLDERKWPKPEEGTWKKTAWIGKQVLLLLFFPIHAMHRFAGRLFWSMEALRCPESEQEEALAEASKTSTAELYLLLQAFFQAAPQALLQTYVWASFKVPLERTGAIPILAITSSIASAAIAAACYMRFESQRVLGRQTPWSTKKKSPEKGGLEPKESLMTTIESQMTSDTAAENSPAENRLEEGSDSPKPPALPKGVPQTAILSLPPLPPQIRARLIKASGDELPEDLQKDYENVVDGEPLNIRTSIYGPDAKSPVREKEPPPDPDFSMLPPFSPAPSLPDAPPPPPPIPLDIPMDDEEDLPTPPPDPREEADLVDVQADPPEPLEPSPDASPTMELKVEENLPSEPLLDRSTATTLQIKPTSPVKNFSSIPLPTRKWKIEGLAEDDFLGKFIGFVWWFLFISSRVIALACLAFFYPWAFAVVVLLHYGAMVFYLFYCEKSEDPSTMALRLGLGFVYLFCFIEIRTRFKDPKRFTVCFVAAGAAENLLSSIGWYFFGVWSSWWFVYAFFLVISSLILSTMAMGLYFIILKPSTHNVYTN